MISQLPFPHEDRVICKLSELNDKFRNHYSADIPIQRKKLCSFCNQEGNTHFHHIIARREMGKHHPSNLIELCPSCHLKAERGEIFVGEGTFFKWGQKKHSKLKRKRAVSKEREAEFFKKHLEYDAVIKELVRNCMYERLAEYTKRNGLNKQR